MLNKIIIHGYLGKDPEIKDFENKGGIYKRAVFDVGVSRDYGDVTDWFKCVAFGDQADIIYKYLHTGSEITVEGHMESYRPGIDNNNKFWNIRVQRFDFCGKKDSRKDNDEKIPDGFSEIADSDDFDLF